MRDGARILISAFAWALVALVAAAFTGCATTGCLDPEERAAMRGLVLECHERTSWTPTKGYFLATTCTVSTAKGDEQVTYRKCR